MSLEYAILGFLSTEELSGYDLKTKCFDEAASHFWTADQAQVYRTLERLQTAGLVTSTRQRQRDRPDRRVYSITRSGRESLADWLASPRDLPHSRDTLLVQVYFGAEITDEALTRVLAARRERHQQLLDGLRARVADVARERDGRRVLLHRMTLDAAIARERAAIDWLDDCIDVLSAAPAEDGGAQRHLFGMEER